MAKAREIPGLHSDMTYAEAAALTVRVRAEEVFEHAAGVLDVGEIERVHDMRVATRRLRAVLEVYAPCFDAEELRPLLRDVKALADALGARRDPDVELLALEQFAASVGRTSAPASSSSSRAPAPSRSTATRCCAALAPRRRARPAQPARRADRAAGPSPSRSPRRRCAAPAPTILHGDGIRTSGR